MKVLVTGGAGFIGSNVAKSFADKGHTVVVVDNLVRPGVEKNVEWLKESGIKIQFKNAYNIKSLHGYDVVFHYAGQVGVQTSIDNPAHDLGSNLLTTFNLLELARKEKVKPMILFASTNKVYGDFETHEPVSEKQPLSFCTPYGCSKGAADQYMLDYFRVYGVPTVVLRMSCIYGNRQMGTEEQGWLCHFMRNKDNPVTVYGDGTQVRDALYIDDYVRLMHALVENKEKVAGHVFNVGGGKENAVSVNEVLKMIGNKKISFSDWRPSDQKYYVSDITKVTKMTGWKPKINVSQGLEELQVWVNQL